MNETTDSFADSQFTPPVLTPAPSAPQSAAAQADHEVLGRIEQGLEELDQLNALLSADEDYVIEPVGYELPPDFTLSVVVPVYNEQATIYTILTRLAALPLPLELVIVDDASTDLTRRMLEPLSNVKNVKLIFKPQNEGKGAALRTGFKHATGDVVVIQDADLEYDPRDIVPLIRPILEGEADVVYGSRFLGDSPQDPSLMHRLGNRLLTGASNLLTGLQLTDMETCYKAFKQSVLQTVEVRQNRFGFEPEVTAKLARRGHRFAEVPIRYDARSYAEGKKIGVKDGFNALYCIVRYGLSD